MLKYYVISLEDIDIWLKAMDGQVTNDEWRKFFSSKVRYFYFSGVYSLLR